jgi:hypothetical protein
MSHVQQPVTSGSARQLARAPREFQGGLRKKRQSDSSTIRYLCTLSAVPGLGSASVRASKVSVKTLTLHATTHTCTHTVLDTT